MVDIVIRPATASELVAVVELRMKAFGYNGTTQALFPDPARRATDFPAWRIAVSKDTFADPGRHIIVAVEPQEDGTEEIAGSAEWVAPGGPEPGLPAEELAAKVVERRKKWPASLNTDVLAADSKVVGDGVKASLRGVGLPEDADKDMWDLKSLAVDAKHQRKGIGQKLVRWGMDRAAEERKNVLIVANPTGAPLYRKMGLEEVGSVVRFAGEPYEQSSWIFLQQYAD